MIPDKERAHGELLYSKTITLVVVYRLPMTSDANPAISGSHAKPAAPRVRWSVRAMLGCLVFACLTPGLVGVLLLFFNEYQNGRTQKEKDTIQTARALTQAVDAQLLKAQVVAQSLASAGSLGKRDFADFHRRAREALTTTKPGTNFVLTDRSGQQIVNTLIPFGQPLPRHGNPEVLAQVFKTEKPVISDLFTGGVTKRPIMSVDVPVVVDGRVTYVLSIGIQPNEFAAILQRQRLPADWVAAIFDATGTIVARTHLAERFVGQKGTAVFIQRIREVPEGMLESTTREGIPVVSLFSRSLSTGWSVGIGIPQKIFAAELTATLWMLGLSMLALFALGIALAWFMGDKIASSVRSLIVPALSLGAGETVGAPRVYIKEAAEVADAMGKAANLLLQRTTALRDSEIRFRATFKQAAVGMAHVSLDGKWLQVNDKLCAIVGYEREELLRIPFQEITYPEDLETDLGFIKQLLAGTIPSYTMEKRYIRKDGALTWVNLTVSLVRTPAGEPDYFVSVIEDIEPRKETEAALAQARKAYQQHLEQQVAERTEALTIANRELDRIAHQDGLTGLQNRLSANERLRLEFLRLKRTGNAYGVLMIDLDHFKSINDTYGHEAGDHVLQQLAGVLTESLRATDFVARFGGEEFLVIMPNTNAEGSLSSAEKLRKAVAEQVFPAVGTVTLSIGVTIAEVTDANEDDAIRRADAALYRAKEAGRNTVRA